VRGDRREVRRRIGIGAERVQPADVTRDPGIAGGEQRERTADADADDAEPRAIDLGAGSQQLERLDDAIDLARFEAALE
jgi:hypothetical protein